jgi:hypothetical protein
LIRQEWDFHFKKIGTLTQITITLTTSFAASSAGTPRHDLAAVSEDKVSQIPSEAMISLPPAFESYGTNKRSQ